MKKVANNYQQQSCMRVCARMRVCIKCVCLYKGEQARGELPFTVPRCAATSTVGLPAP